MEIKLVNTMYNFYDVEIKVKREKPEYYPWENWFGTHLHIEKNPNRPNGKDWSLISNSERMDTIFQSLWGGRMLFLKSKKEVIDAVKQILISMDYKHFYKDLEIVM